MKMNFLRNWTLAKKALFALAVSITATTAFQTAALAWGAHTGGGI